MRRIILIILSYGLLGYGFAVTLENDLPCGFTSDFQAFLKANKYNFDRPDIKCPNYGGKPTTNTTITKTPLIFIHGNNDVGFGRGTVDGYASWQTGFRSLANYLTLKGYTSSSLYTMTWGNASISQIPLTYHSKETVLSIRLFVEAVLKYTKARYVDIISHSMGVTLSRKVIKGGQATDHISGAYNVGSSLQKNVRTFIGLAGANLGLGQCYSTPSVPTCSTVDGFYPGLTSASGPSKFINDINKQSGKQGKKLYTIWSKFDEVITLECLVWGKITCRIINQDQQIIKNSIQWTHFAIRDNTGPDLYDWL